MAGKTVDYTGLFITLEGIEGSGKSTNAKLLSEKLAEKGYPVVLTREPGGTHMGKTLRELILHKTMPAAAELMLLIADRAIHVNEVIRPNLENGAIVVCDRYFDTTYTYQGCGRGLDKKWLRDLHNFSTGGLMPHRTYFLDVNVSSGLARARYRGTSDKFEREDFEFHERIRGGYMELLMLTQNFGRIHRIDGSNSQEQVFQDIWDDMRESVLFDKLNSKRGATYAA